MEVQDVSISISSLAVQGVFIDTVSVSLLAMWM
jgi:hypothetical protein